MAPAKGQHEGSEDGFEGAIEGLGLADVVQFYAQSRFTGCLSIHHGEYIGLAFFFEGSIVHAEQGNKTGEDAFCELLEWPGSRYRIYPGLSSSVTTIQKSCQHLLLDASRILDERKVGRMTQSTQPEPKEPRSRALKSTEIIERVQALPGVLYAVLQTKDGVRVGDQSFEGEVLAGQGSFLAMVGGQLSSVFQAGELVSATVEGKSRHVMLFGMNTHFLCVLVSGTSQAGAVEAQIRQTLSGTR